MTQNSTPPGKLSAHGLFVILAATAVALLATPLAAPAMPEIARVFAHNAETEAFARGLLALISFLPGEPNVPFLVKFILLSIPALFIIAGAPLVGWLSDRMSRKSLLIVSLIVFGVSGTSGYFAESFLQMFIGRAVLGLSIAGIKTATVAMVGDYYTGAERNRIIGWQGSAMKVGGVVFMLLGGWLANSSWQTPFLGYLLAFVLVPSAFIALAGGLPDTSSEPKPEAGAAPAKMSWSTTWVFLSAFLASGLFFVTPVQLPFYLKTNFAATPMQIGAAIALGNTVGALCSLAYHQFRQRMSFPAIHGLVFLSMAAGYFAITLVDSYTGALVGMVIAGLGFGLYVPNHSSWILSIVSAKRRGFGVGLVTTAMFLGQFGAAFIVQPFIDPDDPANVWRAISLILAALAVIWFASSFVSSRAGSNNND